MYMFLHDFYNIVNKFVLDYECTCIFFIIGFCIIFIIGFVYNIHHSAFHKQKHWNAFL